MSQDKITILIKRASLEAEKIQIPFLQSYDLSPAQYRLLKYLYSVPKDSARIVDVETCCSMTHPAVIDILRVLEKNGYTVRLANPEDARSKIVSLTAKAYAVQGELERIGDEMEAAVTSRLDGEDKRALSALLRKLLGN